MSATDLLQHLRSSGLMLTLLDDGRLHVAPRDALTDEHRAAIVAQRDELVQALLAATVEPDAMLLTPQPAPQPDSFWLGTEPPIDHPAPDCDAPADAVERPYRLTKAEGDAAHYPAWDDAAIARFEARVASFRRQGMSQQNAEDLAERLHLRDTEGDDRRSCMECANLERSGRCTQDKQVRLPTADRRVWPVAAILHNCPSFRS